MHDADVIILGGGLVGLTLALALDAHGLTTIVIDPADPATVLHKSFDGRASAVASASHAMLDAIGVGARLAGQGCPIGSIKVSDGLAPRSLIFDADPDLGPLGIMYENRLLRRTLHQAAADAPNVTLLMQAAPAMGRARRGVGARHACGRAQLLRPALDRRGRAQLADARSRGHQGGALAL